MVEVPGVAPPPTLVLLAPWEMPGCVRAAGLDSRPHGVGVSRAASSQVPAGRSVIQGWGVEQGTLPSEAVLGASSSQRSRSDGRAPFARYHPSLRPRLAWPTLGLNHLTPPHPKHKPSPQR